MENYVITISRRFASGGHTIAGELSGILGIPVYDRSAIEARVLSAREGISVSESGAPAEESGEAGGAPPEEQAEEKAGGEGKAAGAMAKRFASGRAVFGKIFTGARRDKIPEEAQRSFEEQSRVILSLAQEGSCIVLGRCGDEVFRSHPRCLNLFIFAPEEVRIKNCMEMLHTDRDDALRMIRSEDRAREEYRRLFSSHPEDETYGRHLLIDSSVLGIEKSAQMIAAVAREKFKEETA